MARKVRRYARTTDRTMMNVVADGAATVSDRVVGTIMDTVRDRTDILMGHMENRIMQVRARLARRMFGSILLGLGILLLFTALTTWLIYDIGLNTPLTFVIIGALMIIAAFIVFAMTRRTSGS